MKTEAEVVIIGGGVAGLSLSKFLENEGIDFLLIEKRCEIGKYGNRVISKEAFKKLDIPKNIVLYNIKKLVFYSPSLVNLSYNSNKERGYVVNLKDIENFLYEKIESKEKILLGKKVVEVDFKKRKLVFNGNTIKYNYIVVACGVDKEFFNKHGINLPPFAFCYAIELENFEEDTCVIFDNIVAKNFYGWIMPLKEGIEIGFGTSKYIKDLKSELFKMKLFQKFKNEKIKKVNAGLIPIDVDISNFNSQNYLLIGDAIGGEPIFGGSIHKAYEDAKLAGEILIENFGDSMKNICKKYYFNWKKYFLEEIEKQKNIRNFLDALTNEKLDELFRKMKNINLPKAKGLINELFRKMIEASKNY